MPPPIIAIRMTEKLRRVMRLSNKINYPLLPKEGRNGAPSEFSFRSTSACCLRRRGQPRARHLRHRAHEEHGVIERLGPAQRHSSFGSKILECNVDVIEHLDVVADEADGLHKDVYVAGGGKLLNDRLHRGPDPGPAAGALALEGELPVAVDLRHAGRDQAGGLAR